MFEKSSEIKKEGQKQWGQNNSKIGNLTISFKSRLESNKT